MTADEIRLMAWNQAAANMQQLLANVAEEIVTGQQSGPAHKFLQNCVDKIAEAGFWYEKASAAMSPLQIAPASQVLS